MVALREVGVMPEELAFKAASVSVRALISTFLRVSNLLQVRSREKRRAVSRMCILYV